MCLQLFGGLGYDDDTIRKHYDAFAKKNERGFISFDTYKERVKQKPDLKNIAAHEADDIGNIKAAPSEDEYFSSVDADMNAKAQEALGKGGTGTRRAIGSPAGGGEQDGYSERIATRDRIRKATGRRG